MRKRVLFNSIGVCFLFFFTTNLYSQIQPTNSDKNQNTVGDFLYENTYFNANPKGLTYFIDKTQMSDEIKKELNIQLKSIKSKRTGAKIAIYSGFAIGTGIFVHEAVTLDKGEQLNSNALYAGFGAWALGAILNRIIRPKKKDYLKFINTFNAQSDLKIELGSTAYTTKQLSLGVAINF